MFPLFPGCFQSNPFRCREFGQHVLLGDVQIFPISTAVIKSVRYRGKSERTGVVLEPRTLGREVPGSSPPVAVLFNTVIKSVRYRGKSWYQKIAIFRHFP